MHETLSFGEKKRIIYVDLVHDPNFPCKNINKPFHYPVVRVRNYEEAEAAAGRYQIKCGICGADYSVPKKEIKSTL